MPVTGSWDTMRFNVRMYNSKNETVAPAVMSGTWGRKI